MNKKAAKETKRFRSHAPAKGLRLSPKELDILEEEMADPGAAQRNASFLHDRLCQDKKLIPFLFNPNLLPLIMQSIRGELTANSALTRTAVKEEDVIRQLVKTLAEEFDAFALLDHWIPYMKELKIKRRKKTLIWAIGELIQTLHTKQPLERSVVFTTLVNASVTNAYMIMSEVRQLLEGKEPFLFDYQKVMNDQLTERDLYRILSYMNPQLINYHLLVSLTATLVFEAVKKPFGLRFYRILHYPSSVPAAPSKLILLSPAYQPETPESSKEELHEKLAKALTQDLIEEYSVVTVKEIVSAIKTAAFGELEPAALQTHLNAATFSLLFYPRENLFLLTLYQKSGEQAEALNPPDELNDIIEIKNSPDNPTVYRRYADRLFDKSEFRGAHQAYLRVKELLPEPDETLENRLRELEEKFKAEAARAEEQTDSTLSTV